LEARLFELFENFSVALIGLIKASPPKKPLLLSSCKQANYMQKVFKMRPSNIFKVAKTTDR